MRKRSRKWRALFFLKPKRTGSLDFFPVHSSHPVSFVMRPSYEKMRFVFYHHAPISVSVCVFRNTSIQCAD